MSYGSYDGDAISDQEWDAADREEIPCDGNPEEDEDWDFWVPFLVSIHNDKGGFHD